VRPSKVPWFGTGTLKAGLLDLMLVNPPPLEDFSVVFAVENCCVSVAVFTSLDLVMTSSDANANWILSVADFPYR
jgi:hypothetical protein